MVQQKLQDGWQLQIVQTGETMAAVVPGSVYGDLLRNGRMENPFWRDNEDAALRLMDNDFLYTAQFDVCPEVLECEQVLLRCEGLDTVAQLTLNGEALGEVCNQHRTWEFDVRELLRPAGNELRILFHSPTRYIKEQYAKVKADGSEECSVGFPLLRKAHCMFGWDWGPRLPDAGIWRDILLLGINEARIDSVYITQHHHDGQVELEFDVQADVCCEDAEISYAVTLTAPDGTETAEMDSPACMTVERPQLWWPNGYGEQPLYTVEVVLLADGEPVDVWKRRIGLRTVTMRIEPDEYGESFAHEVNGVAIFGMGADYIPEDNLFGRITPERTRKLLEQCKAANFNAIRVWGGGYYPDDWFYDICDELGLLVWQDMMFACAVYELTDEFEENIVQELIDNIKRLRHHASLGLWCGNNEMEMFVDRGNWVNTPKQKADYIKMYEYIFPKVLKEYDPNTFYWPASPSSGGSFDCPNDENRGDVHYWDVWHGNKPFSEYRKFFFRYASEFGFQSFPCEKTVESFTLPEDRNIFSYVMEKHQRNASANGKIMNYLYQTYRYPTNFGTLLYASQMLQAEAVKYGVEHWRRNRGRCMGAIYWQLNDCWPVASWASIDYYGRWKALHYYAKRFFAPVMLSCCEEGTMTQEPNVNAEMQDIEKSIRLNVANETMRERTGVVRWALRNADASVVQSGEESVCVPALCSVWLDKVCFPQADLHGQYVSFELEMEGEVISSGTVLFCAPKHFSFLDPRLTVEVDGDELVVTAQAYAKGVELLNENEDWVLEDNYFDMNAGTRRVKILSGEAVGIHVRSVFDIC